LGPDEAARKTKFLFGGQQQRVAIARCLAMGADYILADEPTGNLDGGNAQMIMEIFSAVSKEQGKCVIIATHSQLVKAYSHVSFHLKDKTLELAEVP
jgi:putative ABC transport system ATP-binding protein